MFNQLPHGTIGLQTHPFFKAGRLHIQRTGVNVFTSAMKLTCIFDRGILKKMKKQLRM